MAQPITTNTIRIGKRFIDFLSIFFAPSKLIWTGADCPFTHQTELPAIFFQLIFPKIRRRFRFHQWLYFESYAMQRHMTIHLAI
jgi:hypothetical protein